MNTPSTPYVETYDRLDVTCLTPKLHERTCNYWYTVTSRAQAHTAFCTLKELLVWLNERGLKLTDTVPEERGTYKYIQVEGSYCRASYMDAEAFAAIVPRLEVEELSNGDYTLGKVTQDEEGVRTVHYLNPNVTERIVYPYHYR